MARKPKSAEQAILDLEIGAQIEGVRRVRGMKLAELARRLGVSFQAMYDYETGRTSCPTARLVRLAALLDVPLAKLVPNSSTTLDFENSECGAAES